MTKDLGDFQTPLALVEEVFDCLARRGKSWARILEPTCGKGNFIKGALDSKIPPKEIQGIEIQSKYVEDAEYLQSYKNNTKLLIHHKDIFTLNLTQDLSWSNCDSPLLIIGNPPWITNARLTTLGSSNLPIKTNFKKLNGFDAMTGSSNFDIAEYIWLKLIRELLCEKPAIAMLCKTSVARNIIQFSFDTKLPIESAAIFHIDSRKHFGAMVDACLFYLEIGSSETYDYQTSVYKNLQATSPESIINIKNGHLQTNITIHPLLSLADGKCPLIWRQGMKHDAATVMELTYDADGNLRNKTNEQVDIEQEPLYPLFKSSDVGGKEKTRPGRAVIVTQKFIGENTLALERAYPKLWRYLTDHKDTFERRKSSIYEKQPPFSIFGIGPYSFAPYKVAISGLYKQPVFRAFGPRNEKPVMFDDTCYFIPCHTAQQAALITSLLNDSLSIAFLNSIVFWDAKRPVTKKILQRIDMLALLKLVDQQTLLARANTTLQSLLDYHSVKTFSWPEQLDILLQEAFTTNRGNEEVMLSQQTMLL